MLRPGAARDRLTRGIFSPQDPELRQGEIEAAFLQAAHVAPIERTLRDARRAGLLRSKDYATRIEEALNGGIISSEDAAALEKMIALRRKVISVDSFAQYGKQYALSRQRTRKPAIYAVVKGVSHEPKDRSNHDRGRLRGRPVYVIDGVRTPFLKARGRPGPFRASDLALAAGRALLMRLGVAPDVIDQVVLGCVSSGPDEANIARVVALRLGCGDQRPGLDGAAKLRLRDAGTGVAPRWISRAGAASWCWPAAPSP